MNDLTINEFSPAKNDLKRSIKAVFYILCTFPVIAVFAVIPTYVYVIFSSILGLPISESGEYIFTFAVPQILYPVFTLIAAFFMIGFSGKTKQQLIKFNDPPAVDVLLSLGIFLGMGTVGTYLSDFLTQIIIMLGVPVPDMSEYIAMPKNTWEFALYTISIAIMPAICEEVIFRGIICGIFKSYNKTAAIVFSTIAFSLVHSTVQQIPFAFIMGLFLSYLYVKYDSLIPCILLHFLNNFVSCIFMMLYENISMDIYEKAVMIYDISSVTLGIICMIIFIVLRLKEKSSTNYNIVPAVSGKDFTVSAVFSVPFILFFIIFLFQTVMGILSYYYQ